MLFWETESFPAISSYRWDFVKRYQPVTHLFYFLLAVYIRYFLIAIGLIFFFSWVIRMCPTNLTNIRTYGTNVYYVKTFRIERREPTSIVVGSRIIQVSLKVTNPKTTSNKNLFLMYARIIRSVYNINNKKIKITKLNRKIFRLRMIIVHPALSHIQ